MNFCRRYELPALLALVIIKANPSVSAQTDIPLQNRTPTGTLSGTLTLPAAVTRPDVIVVQPGSGPVDRDGNMPGYRNNHLMMLATALAEIHLPPRPVGEMPDKALTALGTLINGWQLTPAGSEGYAKAEVTVGGIDTSALSSQTMEARDVPGLYAIGEAVDVTGWLGGYNFQWAWSSGFAAGEAI